MDLSDRWPLPESHPGSAELRDRLAAAYAHPSRGYHDTRHLGEVLDRLDELATHGSPYDRTAVVLAAWFHDSVYDGERDAEERSAVWAEEALPALEPDLVDEALVAEVARLVRLTETHEPTDDDVHGCVLSDADLSILAAPRERYEEYVAAVRREYAHLDDATFAAGRLAVLQGLADKPSLFHTAWAREQWEGPARANLERELAELATLTPSR
jgi:predicted metal-dependent HD superfamily phosphohydrolase